MFRWIPYTFVRVTIFLVAGIIVGIYFPDLLSGHLLTFLLAGFTATYITVFFLRRYAPANIFNPGVLGLTSIFLLGWVHVLNSNESSNTDHILNNKKPIQYYIATISRFSEEKEKSWKVEATISNVFSDHWGRNSGKVILYFSKQDFSVAPNYGDVFFDPRSAPGCRSTG